MMQMPVVVFTLELSGPGSQRLFITENNPSVDYSVFVKWFGKVIPTKSITNGLSKDQLQGLLLHANQKVYLGKNQRSNMEFTI
jgi:hypothetical protein